MLPFFVLFFLLIAILSGVTTIPFAVGLLVVSTVLFKKSWVFFAAFGLGVLLDLVNLRPLGYTSLIFTVFVFLIRLYERKFETQTLIFVFFTAFLESLIYLKIFDYNQVLITAFANSLFAVLFFKFLWLKLGPRSETI